MQTMEKTESLTDISDKCIGLLQRNDRRIEIGGRKCCPYHYNLGCKFHTDVLIGKETDGKEQIYNVCLYNVS